MTGLHVTLPTPAENLALDEAILLDAEAGKVGEVLRIWEPDRYFVVLGSGSELAEEVDESSCAADRIPILRRASGGGAVLLGPGCLLYSLIVSMKRPEVRDVKRSYGYILKKMAQALSCPAFAVTCTGTSDLASDGRKISGNSQRRLVRFVLHHGSVLYDFDLELIGRYLRLPRRQPEYRRGRGHLEFLTNCPLPAEEIRSRLCAAWNVRGWENGDRHADVLKQLVQEKHENPAWIRRR
jgi:lipoate-protein ligase A